MSLKPRTDEFVSTLWLVVISLFNNVVGCFVKNCFPSVRRSLLVAAVLSSCAMFYAPADAANSGIDTPTGVTTLPFGVEGVVGMTLMTQNPTIGPVYVGIGSTSPQFPLVVVADADHVLNVRGDPTAWGLPSTLLGPILQGVNSTQSVQEPITLEGSNINLMADVGVGTTSPAGNLDIENGSNTAKLCLNGACATSLPSSPVIFGGMFGEQSGACQFINPITGGCSCPVYAPNASRVLNANMGGGNQNGSIFFCYGTGG
jgi:hypothetical protein